MCERVCEYASVCQLQCYLLASNPLMTVWVSTFVNTYFHSPTWPFPLFQFRSAYGHVLGVDKVNLFRTFSFIFVTETIFYAQRSLPAKTFSSPSIGNSVYLVIQRHYCRIRLFVLSVCFFSFFSFISFFSCFHFIIYFHLKLFYCLPKENMTQSQKWLIMRINRIFRLTHFDSLLFCCAVPYDWWTPAIM